MSTLDEAVEKCKEITKWQISPFACVYRNPHKYGMIQVIRWSQRYLNFRLYKILLDIARVMEYEVVPTALLHGNQARSGFSDRQVKVGKVSFYLLKFEEMSKGLKKRYSKFRKALKDDIK